MTEVYEASTMKPFRLRDVFGRYQGRPFVFVVPGGNYGGHLNRGIVYHVYHTEREQSEEGMQLVGKAIKGTHTRCESGIEGRAVFDPPR